MSRNYLKYSIVILLILCIGLGYQVYSLSQQNKLLIHDLAVTINAVENLNDQRIEFNKMSVLSVKIEACQKQKDSGCVNKLTNEWMQSAQNRDALDKQFPSLWGEMQKTAQQLKPFLK